MSQTIVPQATERAQPAPRYEVRQACLRFYIIDTVTGDYAPQIRTATAAGVHFSHKTYGNPGACRRVCAALNAGKSVEDALKAATPPRTPRCKGCGALWLGGHACMTPSRTPTTDRRVHEAGVTRLYETRPNSAGQWVTLLHYRCGHTRPSCTRSEAAMLEERGLAAEGLCPTCGFRASRGLLDEEQARG